MPGRSYALARSICEPEIEVTNDKTTSRIGDTQMEGINRGISQTIKYHIARLLRLLSTILEGNHVAGVASCELTFVEMGKMGERQRKEGWIKMAGHSLSTEPIPIPSLEMGTPHTLKVQNCIFRVVNLLNRKSRVKGDFHARFCENAGVKFPCVTRLVCHEVVLFQ